MDLSIKSIGKIKPRAGLLLVLLIILTFLFTYIKLHSGPKTFWEGGTEFTHYNNYLIFKQSFFHLKENKDLYLEYRSEYWDFYKYSPTFAALMGLFALFPDFVGLFLWDLLNVLVLIFAIYQLPSPIKNKKIWIYCLILLELFVSVQNSQSNGLIAGLIVFSFNSMEKERFFLASFLIVLSIFIKLFGLIALSLFLFYPHKMKAIVYTIVWIIVFISLPLVFISLEQLIFLYKSWISLLSVDHSLSYGYSVAGWLYSWFRVDAKNLILLIGILTFWLPIIKYKYSKELRYKLLFLSQILVWIVIFNHKAESPSFVIAMVGISIWFFCQPITMENLILLALTAVFTVLGSTDVFPRSVRTAYFIPYVIKVIPCILIYLKIILDMVFYKSMNLSTKSG